MVEQLELKNLSFYKGVVLNRTDADYLLDDDGVDWGSVPSHISSYSSIDGLGSVISNVSISNPRPIRIVGWITQGEDSTIEDKKEYLSKICNPIDPIRITCGAYTIEGRMSSSIKFATTMNENNEEMCKFSLYIECPKPFFTKHIERRLGASTSEPILIDEAASSETVIKSLPITLENYGDFDVGAEFLIELSDTYQDLYVVSQDPKSLLPSFFGLEGTLREGTLFRVITETNRKYVSHYDLWNLNSEWVKVYKAFDSLSNQCQLTLELGVSSSTRAANFEGVALTIKYDILYLSMEDM